MIDRLAESVVQIVTLEDGEPIGTGSGTIVDPQGLIFTNRHVVEGGDDWAILILEDPNERPVLRYFASEVTMYEGMDFATLQIDRDEDGRAVRMSSLDLPFVDPLETASDVRRGDAIYILGYPGVANGYFSFTTGTITTIQNGDVGNRRMPVLIQTDAEIAPGNSGGLAVNADGAPLGIPTEVQVEDRTGGRLGGILPFDMVIEAVSSGAAVVVEPGSGGGRRNPGSPRGGRSIGMDDEVWSCDRNAEITNGTNVTVVQIRPGYSYTATVIGLDDFDPVLMVIDPDGEIGFCNDNAAAARSYTVSLPGIGVIRGGSTDAQVVFTQNTGDLADMQIIVGGYEGQGGEFLLIVEGMGVTAADNVGDPFTVLMNRSLIASDVPLSVFMFGRDRGLDPLIAAYNPATDSYVSDVNDDPLVCDDAGTRFCWGDNISLESAALTIGSTQVLGDSSDSMMTLFPEIVYESDFDRIGFIMSSYNQQSQGQYVLVFHMGLAPAD